MFLLFSFADPSYFVFLTFFRVSIFFRETLLFSFILKRLQEINHGIPTAMHLIHFLSITFPRTPANWKNWETLHIKLLNKLKYRAKPEKWEPVLGRFIFNHAADIDGLPEAAECLVSGVCDRASQLQSTPIHIARPYSPVYYGLGVEVRTRLLLTLLESQFDRNQSFKDKVNLRSAVDLRFRPLGYDVWGRIYWLLKDSEINVLLYREDSEKKAFQVSR